MFLFCRKTETMVTLAKALRRKKKLKNEIEQLKMRVEKHNSVIEGNTRPFDLLLIIKELHTNIHVLSELKAAITKATQPVQQKVFLLAELRSLNEFYKEIEVKEGKQIEYYDNKMIIYEALINESALDEKIKLLEDEAETIQDELEAFNHVTQI